MMLATLAITFKIQYSMIQSINAPQIPKRRQPALKHNISFQGATHQAQRCPPRLVVGLQAALDDVILHLPPVLLVHETPLHALVLRLHVEDLHLEQQIMSKETEGVEGGRTSGGVVPPAQVE